MTKEEMQALQTMMEQVIDSKLQPVHETLKAQEKRTDEKFTGLRQEMRELQQSINGIDMRLDKDFKEIKGLLRDDYGRVEGNAANGAKAFEEQREIKSTQADHARAIQNHNERITVLEEKAI